MSQNMIEQQTVAWVTGRIDGASTVLRTHKIDATNRMSLAVAAAAASVTPGELLAEMDYRGRLQARKLVGTQPAEVELELEV
jgi:hypothetical protein